MSESLGEIYEGRFSDRDAAAKFEIWREIVKFLSRWIDPEQPVLDVACDRAYFLRWVQASERWATDIRDVSDTLPPDVEFVRASGLELESALRWQAIRHDLHEQLPRASRLE